MNYDLSDCLLLNTVMAARAMTRRYDERLKQFEVSVGQFAVLMSVKNNDSSTVSAMAERIAMDRTTLVRNLELLLRRDLVVANPADKGNGRVFSLSGTGAKLVELLIPEWKIAQSELRALLENEDSGAYLNALKILTKG